MDWDVVIIGAGAAGLFCAAEAGARGRRVLLIDHAKSVGEKIRISGGGRCNFTNLEIAPEKFLSANPRFAISPLKRFTQWDFIDRVDRAGIAWHEKTLGQLFCDGSSKEIIQMLLRALDPGFVTTRLQEKVRSARPKAGGFELALESGGDVTCASLVIATGGKSIPKMGATGFGYQVAADFGIALEETRPGLVPLTFGGQELDAMKDLSGLSVEARVASNGAEFEEGLLFTHRGLSGPSILQISSYWREGEGLSIDLCRDRETLSTLQEKRQVAGRQSLKNAVADLIPERLAVQVVERANLRGPLGDQSNAKLVSLHEAVHRWQVKPTGSEGYRTAEVTLGGVSTDALDAKTMEARDVPGLYFIGEVVDVTGWLGGYNFQWAWSSGWVAGQVC